MSASMKLRIRFLGTGSARSLKLGSASAVLTDAAARPLLLIDCGPTTPTAYQEAFASLPPAIFITHPHFDHIGGLEAYFYQAALSATQIKLYVPVSLVPTLHSRLAQFPGLAEGGKNFWDAFQLVPVGERYFHCGLQFDVFPVRHHAYLSAFGLALAGCFVYTGDTRPIPEVLAHFGAGNEMIFHDCTLLGNPSHAGADELAREYDAQIRERLQLYHQHDEAEVEALVKLGFRVLRPGADIEL